MDTQNLGLNLQSGHKVWLSQKVLDWPVTTEEMLIGRTDWQGHYAPWEHAHGSLSERASEQDRACAIFQLKRALEFRDKALRAVYPLNKIAGSEKNAHQDILSKLSIVLPIMRRKLTNLRNDVAHDYTKSPPDIERCQEYSEFVWYFLKSTDHLLSSPIGVLGFDDEKRQGNYSLTFDLEDWTISLSGEFDTELLTQAGEQDDIEVEIFKASVSGKKIYFDSNPHTRKGSICKMSRTPLLKLLKTYFSTRY